MGSSNTSKKEEQRYIFDLLSDIKWSDKQWKTFCVKFEYKLFSKENDKFHITWDEFESILLKKSDLNYAKEYLIFHTFRKFFQIYNMEAKLYKIYILYFTLVLHVKEFRNISFIEMLFEKIISNLELEIIKEASHNQGENDDDLDIESIPKEKGDDEMLLNAFRIDFERRKKFENVRKINLELFVEILYTFFYNNIYMLIKCFKTVLEELPVEYSNIKFYKEVKVLDPTSINIIDLSKLRTNAIEYINARIDAFITSRAKLQSISREFLTFTFDDIYAFININPCYFNIIDLYNEYVNIIKN